MLKFYIDDSGSDPQPDGIFALAGYLMEEARWEHFADLWRAQLKRPYSIDYCRMSDAESGEGLFVGVDRIHRNRKVKDLAEVIHECELTPIACSMTWKDYNALVKGRVDSRLDNPYAVLFFQILRGVTELQIKFNENLPPEVKDQHGIAIKPVEFIFDDQGSAGRKCLQWYAGLRERVPEPHRTVISNTPQFKDDRELPPLQAAEMLAWHLRREFDFPNEDRKDLMNLLIPLGLLWEREINKEDLEQVVDAFNHKVDPTSI